MPILPLLGTVEHSNCPSLGRVEFCASISERSLAVSVFNTAMFDRRISMSNRPASMLELRVATSDCVVIRSLSSRRTFL